MKSTLRALFTDTSSHPTKKRRSGAVTDLLKFLEDKLSYKIKRKKIISKNIKYR